MYEWGYSRNVAEIPRNYNQSRVNSHRSVRRQMPRTAVALLLESCLLCCWGSAWHSYYSCASQTPRVESDRTTAATARSFGLTMAKQRGRPQIESERERLTLLFGYLHVNLQLFLRALFQFNGPLVADGCDHEAKTESVRRLLDEALGHLCSSIPYWSLDRLWSS
jgi:hypothetical protein